MNINFLMAIAGFTSCVILTPVVRRIAIRNGWFDLPGNLKIHSTPVPRLGGVALMAGILASISLFPSTARNFVPVIVILALVWAVGLLDDLKGTSPLLRLSIDFGCGAGFWFMGWRLQWFSNPYLDFISTVAFLAFAINSINMLDGMDGLALTVSGIAGIGFILLFPGQGFATGLAWSLTAVCAAMLIYNRPPARIFIGDSGSTLLGAILAFLCLEWVRSDSATHSTLVPLLFVALPLADALAAVVRRLRGKQSPFAGDRRHFYDLLLRRGWTVGQILTVSAAATSVLVSFSLMAARGHVGYWLPIFGGLGLCGLLGFHLGSFNSETPEISRSVSSPHLKQSLNQE